MIQAYASTKESNYVNANIRTPNPMAAQWPGLHCKSKLKSACTSGKYQENLTYQSTILQLSFS